MNMIATMVMILPVLVLIHWVSLRYLFRYLDMVCQRQPTGRSIWLHRTQGTRRSQCCDPGITAMAIMEANGHQNYQETSCCLGLAASHGRWFNSERQLERISKDRKLRSYNTLSKHVKMIQDAQRTKSPLNSPPPWNDKSIKFEMRSWNIIILSWKKLVNKHLCKI